MEGNQGITSRIWGSRLCPVLESLEDLQLPQIPPKNLHFVPPKSSVQGKTFPSSWGNFGAAPPELGEGSWGGFGFILGDFGKASGSQTSRQEGEKGFVF